MGSHKGLFAAASLTLLSACATPTMKVDLTDECLMETTGPDGQRSVTFSQGCGEHKVELANTTIRTTQEEARKTVEVAQRVEAMRLLAVRARVEIGNPELEDQFSRTLLAALEDQDPAIRKLASDTMANENVRREDLSAKVAHWNNLRRVAKDDLC
jgi:hypothetical protein